MAERNPTAPNALLAQWVEKQGEGAMKSLVEASGRTWAAIGHIVWHGAVPKSETAVRLAKATGFTTDEIIESAIAARDAKRQAEEAA